MQKKNAAQMLRHTARPSQQAIASELPSSDLGLAWLSVAGPFSPRPSLRPKASRRIEALDLRLFGMDAIKPGNPETRHQRPLES